MLAIQQMLVPAVLPEQMLYKRLDPQNPLVAHLEIADLTCKYCCAAASR